MDFKKFFINIFSIFIIFNLLFPISTCFATETSLSDTSDDFSNIDVSVDAPVALLMDANSGKILYEKNAYEKMYPASTTKIMTAILALENRELSHVAKVSYNAIFTVPSGYTNANLQLDEELTIEQLLNVLLIPSANDAANVIAEDIGGSVESFANMMNTKASEIGCLNTHFVNPNGVHNEDHYSTAYDLALMGRYAMQNETFRNLVSTVKYTLPVTNKYDKTDRTFTTTNKLINSNSSLYYEYATGIKTGYTDAAKNCIVAGARKDDMDLICVILGASNDSNTNNKFKDCINLFDYGFDHYAYKTLHSKDDVYKVISPHGADNNSKSLNVLFDDNIKVLIKKSDNDTEFLPEVELDTDMKAPIAKGTVVGKISYTILRY